MFAPPTERFIDQRQRFDDQLLLRGFVYRVEEVLQRSATSCAGSTQHTRTPRTRGTTPWRPSCRSPATTGALNDVLSDVAEFAYGADPVSTSTAVLIAGYDQVDEISPPLARSSPLRSWPAELLPRDTRAVLGAPLQAADQTFAVSRSFSARRDLAGSA